MLGPCLFDGLKTNRGLGLYCTCPVYGSAPNIINKDPGGHYERGIPYSVNTPVTPVGTPEKKDDKKVVEKKVVEKNVEEVDEDSKASENGDLDKPKENGTSDEKDSSEDSKDKDAESNENGDSTESCPVKRKSGAGDAPDGTPTEGASPEKKAKLEEKPAAEEKAEANGKEEVAA
uniref:(California timema) hypothetical protein n=2 Tax=Timema TaxID=61471 RepID=A0A7R9JB45_TIMCA|nr:unnamed protein product [Timema californicum]